MYVQHSNFHPLLGWSMTFTLSRRVILLPVYSQIPYPTVFIPLNIDYIGTKYETGTFIKAVIGTLKQSRPSIVFEVWASEDNVLHYSKFSNENFSFRVFELAVLDLTPTIYPLL